MSDPVKLAIIYYSSTGTVDATPWRHATTASPICWGCNA